MLQCIFCKSTTGPFNTKEHILPESLGGENWALLPDGLLCDACQNSFGSSVEQQALNCYPFNQLRILFRIPTKKSRLPWYKFNGGTIRASPSSKTLEYEPSTPFIKGLKKGKKPQITFIAEPKRPDMICRFLLKMGLEVIASKNTGNVFNEKYDCARKYALLGDKSIDWWYLQREDMAAINMALKTGTKPPSWIDPVKLEVSILDNGAEIFCLKFYYLEMLTTMLPDTVPSLNPEIIKEPEYRLFKV